LWIKQGGFVLALESLESPTGVLDLLRFVGGPKLLLPHRASTRISSTEAASSSFRGDRRLIRVVIARYIVDQLVRQLERSEGAAAAAIAAKE